MAKRKLPEPALLRQYLSYDPETGMLTWIKAQRGTGIGDIAGCVDKSSGRVLIGFNSRLFLASRVIWAIVTGKWPTRIVDHINRNALDNRWCNLREATKSQNQFNQGMNRLNTSGYKGVSLHKKTGKWTVRIGAYGHYHYIGLFETKEEAHSAYVDASKKLHGEFSYCHQIRPSGAKR